MCVCACVVCMCMCVCVCVCADHLFLPGNMADMNRPLVQLTQQDNSCCGVFLSVHTDQVIPGPLLKVLHAEGHKT